MAYIAIRLVTIIASNSNCKSFLARSDEMPAPVVVGRQRRSPSMIAGVPDLQSWVRVLSLFDDFERSPLKAQETSGTYQFKTLLLGALCMYLTTEVFLWKGRSYWTILLSNLFRPKEGPRTLSLLNEKFSLRIWEMLRIQFKNEHFERKRFFHWSKIAGFKIQWRRRRTEMPPVTSIDSQCEFHIHRIHWVLHWAALRWIWQLPQ